MHCGEPVRGQHTTRPNNTHRTISHAPALYATCIAPWRCLRSLVMIALLCIAGDISRSGQVSADEHVLICLPPLPPPPLPPLPSLLAGGEVRPRVVRGRPCARGARSGLSVRGGLVQLVAPPRSVALLDHLERKFRRWRAWASPPRPCRTRSRRR
jgi:hypothetical protein